MRQFPISAKIEFVRRIINSTENTYTKKYYNDIINYINELKHDNDTMYEANIHLADELNAIKKENKDNELG